MLGATDIEWTIGLFDKIFAKATRVALRKSVAVGETHILVTI
jgi:hypothetical protein